MPRDGTKAAVAVGLVTVVALIAVSRRVMAAEPLSSEDIALMNLIISPATVEENEMVKVSVVITNISDKTGSYTINLGGDFMTQKTVSLAPGESKTVTFEVVAGAPGSYNVEVDGQFGSFNVVEPAEADIRLSNLTITPAEVVVGETVHISVTARNFGDAPGSRTIILEVT